MFFPAKRCSIFNCFICRVSNRLFYGILLGTLVVYLLGMRLDVMEVDAAQYAEMSWEMFTTGSYLKVYNLGADYLDKPPLLFWLNSICFTVFGAGNFTYKLPSLLFALLGVYSTYRLARIFYEENTARLAAVVLATAQALFLITNDVRTDTMLMGAVVFSIWKWAAYFTSGGKKNLLLGSLGVGLALLAKGPIGLIAVGAAVVPHLVWKGHWRKLFDWRLVFTLVIIAAMLAPMCIGLYQQFGVKGLRFYFWTQSFGRVTGESEWNNHPDPLFLVHSTAWQIAPWTIYFFSGWFVCLYAVIKLRFARWALKEYISLSGFTLILLALSQSRYQLPHYIVVVFPLAAIITAGYINSGWSNLKLHRIFTGIQAAVLVALFTVAALLQYCFLGTSMVPIILLVAFATLTAFVFKRKGAVLATAVAAILFNALMSGFYFPSILQYQAGGDFGRFIREHKSDITHFVTFQTSVDFSTAFYARQTKVPAVWDVAGLKAPGMPGKKLMVITGQAGLQELKNAGVHYTIKLERVTFPVARMNLQFLNPQTRSTVCNRLYLVQF